MWKNFVQHTIKEEDKFWNVDFVIDEIMDDYNIHSGVMTITGDTSDSDDDLGCATLT